MDVLYYSNNCKYCQKLLAHLAKIGVLDKYNFICIDRRSVDPNTRQITITLDRGVKTTLPPNVSRVPTLLLVNQKYTAVIGDDIYTYVESKVQPDPNNMATANGGEPIGYIISPSSGGVNIVSETFTMYNAPPEELSAKGNGGTRQMYNYVSANDDGYNDTWRIENIQLFPSNRVLIVNRWGDVVYQSDFYNNDWDGTATNAGGGGLPDGTYYYVIQIEGENEPRTGTLTIWR
jgi:gliding motility-associated-like protein